MMYQKFTTKNIPFRRNKCLNYIFILFFSALAISFAQAQCSITPYLLGTRCVGNTGYAVSAVVRGTTWGYAYIQIHNQSWVVYEGVTKEITLSNATNVTSLAFIDPGTSNCLKSLAISLPSNCNTILPPTSGSITIQCPSNISATASNSGGLYLNYSHPVAVTTCNVSTGISMSLKSGLPSGSYFSIGTHSIVFEVKDQCGNVKQCSFSINVGASSFAVGDLDADNDGLTDGLEGASDNDSDGVPNMLDLDSDNDGIPDLIEAGGVDTNGDGLIDDSRDVNGNGLYDMYDVAVGGYKLFNRDTDGDGIPNSLDLDSDNDGIPDIVEVGGLNIDLDYNGRIDNFSDADKDGLADSVDANFNNDASIDNPLLALMPTGMDNTNDGLADTYLRGNNDTSLYGTPNDSNVENLMYVWFGDNDRQDADFVSVVNFDQNSPNYGKVITNAPLEGRSAKGNEPHHMGLSKLSNQMIVGGLLSFVKSQDEVFFYDIKDPKKPLYMRSFDVPLSSTTDEFQPLPNGNYFITMMGSADGGAPGRLAEFTADGKLLEEWPKNPPKGFNPHGISIRPDLDLMITTDFLLPSSTVKGPLVFPSTVRLWKLSTREIIKTIPIFESGGTMDIQFIPNDPEGKAVVPGFGGKIWLIDTRRGAALPIFDFKPYENSPGAGVQPHIVKFSKDGKKMFIPTYIAGKMFMFDFTNHYVPKVLSIVPLGEKAGIHYMRLTEDEKRLIVTGYFVSQHYNSNDRRAVNPLLKDGIVALDGDRKTHVLNIEGDRMYRDNRFELDGDDAFITGPARPHAMILNTITDKPTSALPNPYDLDSDNDGILDVLEAHLLDNNRDGIADGTDSNKNGWVDHLEGKVLSLPNTDGHGRPNFLDIDSDNDGIVDNIEGISTANYHAPTGLDNDGDGIDDAYDNNDHSFGGNPVNAIQPVDTDKDGTPDFADIDSDNDGIRDNIEAYGNNISYSPAYNDADGDGLITPFDKVDYEIIPTNSDTPLSFLDVASTPGGDRDWREASQNNTQLLTCPRDIIVYVSKGVKSARVTYTSPLMRTSCGSTITVRLLQGLLSGSSFPIGVTPISLLVSDPCSNTATCNFAVSVQEQPSSFEGWEDILEAAWQADNSVHGTNAIDHINTNNSTLITAHIPNIHDNYGHSNNLINDFGVEAKIYPNPASTYLNVDFKAEVGEKARFRVTDMAGHLVREYRFAINNQLNTYQLDVETLPNGIYTVGIFVDEFFVKVEKVVISQ